MSILIVLFCFFAAACWAGWCNHRTLKQRMRLIDTVYGDEKWRETRTWLDTVSYDKHFLTMLTFRNPMKLYPAVLQDAVK